MEWADACRWLKQKGTAYAPAEVIRDIAQRFPWLSGWIDFHPADEPLTFGDWVVSCWRVNHGHNGYAYAYRFENRKTGFKWAYCSDSINLNEGEKAPLRGLDLLVLGTSFYEEPYPFETRSVYDVVEAIELHSELAPGRMLLTHLSHDIDVERNDGLPNGMEFARTGMSTELD